MCAVVQLASPVLQHPLDAQGLRHSSCVLRKVALQCQTESHTNTSAKMHLGNPSATRISPLRGRIAPSFITFESRLQRLGVPPSGFQTDNDAVDAGRFVVWERAAALPSLD